MIFLNHKNKTLWIALMIHAPLVYAACPMEKFMRLDRGHISHQQTYVVSSSSLTDLPSKISSSSGCGESYGVTTPTQEYLVKNYPLLQEDAAKGTGSAIAALEVLEGCHPNTLGKIMQKHYGQLFEKDHPKTTYHELQRLLTEEDSLKFYCNH